MPQFTKNALIESFIKLLNEMPLDKITVKDIVEDCGVNRNTFYYYFHDIYDLVDEIFIVETKKALEDRKIFNSWQEAFLYGTTFARENKKVIYHAYNSLSRETIEQYLYKVTDKIMYEFVLQQSNDTNAIEQDIKFIADFYKFALVGITLDWICKGMRDDPTIFVEKMGKLFEGNIKKALQNSK